MTAPLRLVDAGSPKQRAAEHLAFATKAAADADRYQRYADVHWTCAGGLPDEHIEKTYHLAQAHGYEQLAEASREAVTLARQYAEAWAS